jgi:hypothetical protein
VTSHAVLSGVLLPAFAGLAVGFFIGLATGILATLRWVARRRERGAAVPIYTDETNPNPGHVPWRGREHLSRLGWVFVALGLLGILMGSYSLYQNNATANCLRDYIERSSEINQQRAAGGEIDRQGIRQQRAVTREFNQVLIDSVTNPTVDPAAREAQRQDFLVKANDWNARLDEVDRLDRDAERLRRENPLPAQPDCG